MFRLMCAGYKLGDKKPSDGTEMMNKLKNSKNLK
jgi:hypothetical protein